MNKFCILFLSLLLIVANIKILTFAGESDMPHSGYLGSDDIYDRLEKAETDNGNEVYRWIGPRLNLDNYSSILVDDVVLYPKPVPNEQVSEDTLKRISAYTTNLLKEKIGSVAPLADAPGPEVLQIQLAITGVQISTEGMKPYEVVPVAAVFGAAKALTGKRAQEVLVHAEVKFVDSTDGELVGAIMRSIEGDKLKSKKDEIHVEEMHENLEQSTTEAASFMGTVFTE